jgi:prephenate dehydrogenase
VLTDVSSTKASVVAAARAGLGARLADFVAAHPLAGSERSGPAAAQPDLLDGAWVVTCPVPENPPAVVQRVTQLWAALGARVTALAPAEHDQLCAEVSHWPHAVAFALAAAIGAGAMAERAQTLHGPGLRDTTRIAAASPELWAGILLDNRVASLAAAAAFRQALAQIEQALQAEDRANLTAALARGAQWRSRLETPAPGPKPPFDAEGL